MSQRKSCAAIIAAVLATTSAATGAQSTALKPDMDPEYLVAGPAFVRFVMLPRGGWPKPADKDPSYETLRFGAPRIVSVDAGEGYMEGDILIGSEQMLVAYEAISNVLGPIIKVEANNFVETSACANNR